MAKKEINLFMLEEDERELLRAAEQLGFRVLRTILQAGEGASFATPTEFEFRDEELFMHLVPPEVPLADIPYRIVNDGRARVQPSAPAIELMRSYREGEGLQHGRLYVHVPTGHPHLRVAERGFSALGRIVKRWPETTELHCRVGPAAEQASAKGEIRLMSAARELRIGAT